ncbi:facilitated trehalose transporter Tret1-like [Topomyia yanbarensis]|uniref:facilitated trehalose transporter Tret1-like n=1 Tax=Topomyia yanbarensis TaxID=2498891 RepID=UPI00273B754D|nr:facilitated trehalose transporter Tret1-like [Topomyia yanbarensis]
MESSSSTKKSYYVKQYLAAVVATLGAFSIGTIFGWSSPAEPRILENGETGFTIEKEDFAWAVSLMGLGGTIISFPTGLIVKSLGARKTLLLFVPPTIVGWVLIIWCWNAGTLLVGRLFTGFGAGAFCMVVPIYIGEVASKEIRGTVGSFFQQMINLGILYAYTLGIALNVFQLSILCGIVPVVYGALFFFMPDTPTYLVLRNNERDAVKSIKWLRGSHFDATVEVDEIRSQQHLRGPDKRSVWTSFRQPATVRALCTMLGLMFFMQMTGVNAVLFYSTSIFQSANVTIEAEVATIIMGGMQVLGTLLSSLIVDRAGRRVLLLVSGGVMMVSALVLGVYLQLLSGDAADQLAALGWIPIAALCLYVTLFSVGFGPVTWLMLGEIFAQDVKGPASALANMTSFALSFALSRLFPLARDAIGSGPTFIIFAGFCLLAVVFVAVVVPETKGKSLSEIQRMLATGGGRVGCKVNK